MQHQHGGNLYGRENVTDFSANINFRGMPESVRRRALFAVEDSVHYPDPNCRDLRKAIAAREGIGQDQLVCGNGAAEVLFGLAFAARPKRALLAQPGFFEYEQALLAAGCVPEHTYLKEEEGFRLGEAFLERVEEEAWDMVILGNPNNPTGGLIERAILAELLEICGHRGARLVVDESFFDFLEGESRSQTLECTDCLERYPGLFVVKSFTKMYAMPGLRFGYGCSADRELLGRMRALWQPWNVSLPAQRAAEAAAGELAFARETAGIIGENRERMVRGLRDIGYPVFASCANFLLLKGPAGLQEYGLTRGVMIRDCGNFRGLSEGYYRICIRSREENQWLLEILADARRELADVWL